MLPAASPGAGPRDQHHSYCLPEESEDPKLLLNTGLCLLLLLWLLLLLRWEILSDFLFALREEGTKNKEQEDYSPHTGAGLHLLESNLCWPQLCPLAWLTFCPNLWLAAPDPGNQIPWSCIYTLTPSCEARSDPHVCWVHPALELPIALPGLSDLDPASPQEAPGGRAHTLPSSLGILSTQQGVVQQTPIEGMIVLVCLGAAHTSSWQTNAKGGGGQTVWEIFLPAFLGVFLPWLIPLICWFWLCWVFIAECGLSLDAVGGEYSPSQCTGFSLPWLLLFWSVGSRAGGLEGFCSCSTWA